MSFIPKTGPWRGIEFENRGDFQRFTRNPAEHYLWESMQQLQFWTDQYDSHHGVLASDSLRRGAEFRYELERVLRNDKKGVWYETKDGTLRFEFDDLSPTGPAAQWLEWLKLRERYSQDNVGDTPRGPKRKAA